MGPHGQNASARMNSKRCHVIQAWTWYKVARLHLSTLRWKEYWKIFSDSSNNGNFCDYGDFSDFEDFGEFCNFSDFREFLWFGLRLKFSSFVNFVTLVVTFVMLCLKYIHQPIGQFFGMARFHQIENWDFSLIRFNKFIIFAHERMRWITILILFSHGQHLFQSFSFLTCFGIIFVVTKNSTDADERQQNQLQ